MDTMLVILIVFIALLIAMIIGVCLAYCYSRSNKKSARSTRTIQTEEISGGPGPCPSSGGSGGPPSSMHKSGSKTASAEHIEMSPMMFTPKSTNRTPINKSKTMTISGTKSAPEKSGSTDNKRLKMKHFKYNGLHKRFTKIADGPLVHTYSRMPHNQTTVAKIETRDIKGDITMYTADFSPNLPLLAASRRKAEILEQYYHLDSQSMDNAVYKRKRTDSCMIPEPIPVEGNHERVKNAQEGIPCLEIKPHLAKMPAKRDDTIRHFILNTQYAARLAVRFVSPSARYTCIPSHEIVEACGRLRVVIVANHDMDEQPEKEVVYFEYTQVPERAMDAVQEFTKRPVIGRIPLRLFPNMLNLSPNTFYPSTRRRTIVYTSTLTNSGKTPCKFLWPDEKDVIVSPQNGFIKPQSSVQFSFTLKKPVTNTAIVAEMKYALASDPPNSTNDKPNAHGTITARFETADMKRMMQLSTKALAACDTAEDPGNFS